jgi:DNA-binding transcriptional MerR regulator
VVFVDQRLRSIGEVAACAGVSTSAIRYYVRRGLLSADARHSGQRRYQQETLRRLVFIGMLQEAGLALDDIDDIEGIWHAANASDWKAIATRRLEDLDERIATLQHAREVLAAGPVLSLGPPSNRMPHRGRRDRPTARTHGATRTGMRN